MKTVSIVLAALALSACSELFPKEQKEKGSLEWAFRDESYAATKAAQATTLPDTSEFVLNIQGPGGETIYSGEYGKSPERMDVEPGTYTINAVSSSFNTPRFSAPQYGDTQVVTVASGKTSRATLDCRMINSGIKLKINENFLTSYPSGALLLKSAEGKLAYSYSEKRIAYFNPGAVSLILSNGATDEVLLTRTLASQQILTINISADAPTGDDPKNPSTAGIVLKVEVDTSALRIYEDFIIGGSNGGSGSKAGGSMDTAYNITAIREHVSETGVWMVGYIVGGDLTSSATGISFESPFKSQTNLAIASRASVSSKESCISVALPKGEVREELNLVDHPENLGKRLFLKGDIVEAYYGITGIKNIEEFLLK